MLVLNRKPGERMFIGEDICITILTVDANSNSVRIGVDAPKEVSIMREEALVKRGQEIPEKWR